MDPSRVFMRDVKRIVVKVGTAVVTHTDGKLALGRLGNICEQVKALINEGREVIFVTSGAVGVGKQKLRTEQFLHSSLYQMKASLQNEDSERQVTRAAHLDDKACAAVGQSGLMAFYDHMFGMSELASAQLLVTDSDFDYEDFKAQLSETVRSLIALKVVPVINENDAISTRTTPYKDSSGLFWDNDSLAGLIARELKADLLILLSDVEGLYTGPPADYQSKIIYTYLKHEHERVVTFGPKSRVGRGGMQAKVDAALFAADAGIPVIVTSGYAPDIIKQVVRGDRIGTLFPKLANPWGNQVPAHQLAIDARDASHRLQKISSASRRQALLDVANALLDNEEDIMSENRDDVGMAFEDGKSRSLIKALTLREGKIANLVKEIKALADMKDPLGRTSERREVSEGLTHEKLTLPVGIVLAISEIQPETLPQMAALALRTGNGLLLKGGKESTKTNAILHKVISEALPESVGPKLIGLVNHRDEVIDLLKMEDVIDLIIPRGSHEHVSKIKSTTSIPVLDHADGVCHVYVDQDADLDMANKIILDSKVIDPTATNAMETLLIHESLVRNEGWDKLRGQLRKKRVVVYGGPKALEVLNLNLEAATLHEEYNALACTVEVVKDVHAAIIHIRQYGSCHVNCIITEDKQVAEAFVKGVDSASVFINASTRFAEGSSFGPEAGISTGRIHPRGFTGVEGLLTTRWLLTGNGQVVDDQQNLNGNSTNGQVADGAKVEA